MKKSLLIKLLIFYIFLGCKSHITISDNKEKNYYENTIKNDTLNYKAIIHNAPNQKKIDSIIETKTRSKK
jgi:hypothetical protein